MCLEANNHFICRHIPCAQLLDLARPHQRTYTGHKRPGERSPTPCAVRLIWSNCLLQLARSNRPLVSASQRTVLAQTTPAGTAGGSAEAGSSRTASTSHDATSNLHRPESIPGQLKIFLGDRSSPLPQVASQLSTRRTRPVCLSCACNTGQQKNASGREATDSGLQVKRLSVNLTRRGRDRIRFKASHSKRPESFSPVVEL